MSGADRPAGIEVTGAGDVQVDADALAAQLGLSQEALRKGMGDGSITSRVERGEGEDAGRMRLTVFTPSARLRIVVDETGAIIGSDRVDFGDLPLPPGIRRA